MIKKIAFLALYAIGLTAGACNSPNTSKSTPSASAAPKPDSVIIPKTAKPVTGHLLGVWYDEEIKSEQGDQIAYEVISDGKKVFIQVITFAGTKLQVSDMPEISPSATALKKDKDGYVNIANPTEVYKIDKKGNLLIYDNNELVMTCKKLM